VFLFIESKRAFSAPPTDIGKIVLQRMELKSPLTIKNGSTLSFQQNCENGNSTMPNNQNKYLSNRYNNRNILKTNTLQPQPQRIVRALSERPQNIPAGYDTDTGVLGYNQRASTIYRQNNNSRNGGFDSDTESFKAPLHRNIYNNNSSNQRYNDPNGYDTDTGLLNARKSLNQRLINSKYDSSTLLKSSNANIEQNQINNSSLQLNNDVNISSNFKFNNNGTATLDNKQPSTLKNESIHKNIAKPDKNKQELMSENKSDRKKFDDSAKNNLISISSHDIKEKNKIIHGDIDSSNKSAFHSINSKKGNKINDDLRLDIISNKSSTV
jgi:hypothetical protein